MAHLQTPEWLAFELAYREFGMYQQAVQRYRQHIMNTYQLGTPDFNRYFF